MAAIPNATRPRHRAIALEWWPVVAGLLVLYVPTFYGLGSWLWQQDEYAHGPIVLAIIAWLFWRERAAILSPDSHRSTAAGFALLLFSLAAYILGRSHQIALFEVGSLAPLLAGVLLAMRGWPALRALWFPICFVVFLIPLPGFFVDALTGPLKQAVSRLVVEILHPVGYPIARDGVMLTVGQYQLLVADACSGMNSMFSLSALGLLFMHLSGRRSLLHSAVMLASILPIAFVANIVRVLALILITFHFGDAAGQGFLHGAAGMVLVLAALAFLLALDSILTRIHKPQISN